ncbi:hypothetical protein U1Q18_024396 [Sarracenia purpurea var. burkii]
MVGRRCFLRSTSRLPSRRSSPSDDPKNFAKHRPSLCNSSPSESFLLLLCAFFDFSIIEKNKVPRIAFCTLWRTTAPNGSIKHLWRRHCLEKKNTSGENLRWPLHRLDQVAGELGI